MSLLLAASPALAQDHNDLAVEQLEQLFQDQPLNLPKTIANEKEARELDCKAASLKASTKSCILSRFAYYEPTEVLLVVVYDQASSGEFVRRHAFTRYTKYHLASASLRQVFAATEWSEHGFGKQFILVENEAGTGTGYRNMKWELIGWDGRQLRTAFTATSSCYGHPGFNGYDFDISGRLTIDPGLSRLRLAYEFTAKPSEADPAGPNDNVTGHWDEEYIWNDDTFGFESTRPPAKLIRDFARGLCDTSG